MSDNNSSSSDEWRSSQEELFSSSSGLSDKVTSSSDSSCSDNSDCFLSSDSDISSDENNCEDDPEFDPDLDKPILPGLNCSVLSVLQIVLVFYMRHNLTGVALEDLLLLINTILGVKALPSSKYLFIKMFSKYYNPRFNFYCKICLTSTGTYGNISEDSNTRFRCINAKCLQWNSFDWGIDSNYFITFPLEQQLKETILKNAEDFIIDRKTSYENKLTDFHDGTLFKNKPNIERKEISLTLNSVQC